MSNRYHKLSLLLLLAAMTLAACGGATAEPESDAFNVDSITLERQPCFGTCPVYTLTIHGDGRVQYDGLNHVEVTGPQTGSIDPAAVQSLADAMTAAGYFDFADTYVNQDVTDHPYAITSLTVNGTTKRIEHYYGDFSAPEALTELEAQIDATANSAQWVGTP